MDQKIKDLILEFKKSKGLGSMISDEEKAQYGSIKYSELSQALLYSVGMPESIVCIDTDTDNVSFIQDGKRHEIELRIIGFQIKDDGKSFFYPI